MDTGQVVTLQHPVLEAVGAATPNRKSVLSFGGCKLAEIFGDLGDFVDKKHYWRLTILSLGSEPMQLNSTLFENSVVSNFAVRETSKVLYNSIKNSDADLISFNITGDFFYNHLKVGDTIIPDFRSDLFGPEFIDITFSPESELAPAEILLPDSDYYWDLWKTAFDKVYRELFVPKIQDGKAIVFLSSRLSQFKLAGGELLPLPNRPVIIKRNRRLDEIEMFVSKYEGIRIVTIEPQVLYTSAYSPWGGPWEAHPERAFYGWARAQMLDIVFPDQSASRTYLARYLASYDTDLDRERTANEAHIQQSGGEQISVDRVAISRDDLQQLKDEIESLTAAVVDCDERLRASRERNAALKSKIAERLDEKKRLQERLRDAARRLDEPKSLFSRISKALFWAG